MKTTCKWRRLVFSVEVFFLLYIFLVIFQTFFYQQYYFQRLAQERLSNYTDNATHQCLVQHYIVSFIGNASFVALQTEVNHLNMYTNIASMGIAFIASVALGSVSDRLGRKPVAGVAVIGIFISTILQTLIVYFEWNPYFFILVLSIHGASGGFPLILGICYAMVTDLTSKRWLAVRMAVLEAAIAFSRAAGYLSTNNWIHNTKCAFFHPSLLCVGVSVLALIYLYLMPETAPSRSQQDGMVQSSLNNGDYLDSKEVHQSRSGISEIFNGLKIYFNPFYTGVSNWWRICAVTTVICLACACSIGGTEITNFFLHNKPLQWTYDKIGWYGAISSVVMGFVLAGLVPILVLCKIPYGIIGLLGAASGITSNVITAMLKNSMEMYIAGFFVATQMMTYPVLRVLLQRYVSISDTGAVFTMCAAFQVGTSVLATVVFNEVYHPEAMVNGHMISASTVFWIMTGMWTACIPFLLCLQFIKDKKFKHDDIETEPLLVEDGQAN